MREVVWIDGARTPFQRVATGFADETAYRLGAATLRGLLTRLELSGDAVDRLVVGHTVSNPRATNVAREIGFEAGLPATVPAVTVTAAGASATEAIARAVDWIATGQADVVVAGGADVISDPPIRFRRAMRHKLLRARRLRGSLDALRFAASLRPWDFLPDVPEVAERTTGQSMGAWTEALARRLEIGRAEQDAFAARSHRRAHTAREQLARAIVPVRAADGTILRDDNGVRPDSSLETLGRLRPAFARGGTLTPGNSSFLTDGAALGMLAAAEVVESLGLAPRAVVRGHVLTAHDPHDELLLGPVFAIARLLDQAGLDFDTIDVFELHEAFAAQVLAVRRLLADSSFALEHLGRLHAVGSLPEDRLNAWGGSLALGNPFAPNGARLVTTAVDRLHAEGGRLAVVATCAGGALGQAMLLERL